MGDDDKSYHYFQIGSYEQSTGFAAKESLGEEPIREARRPLEREQR